LGRELIRLRLRLRRRAAGEELKALRRLRVRRSPASP